MHLKNARELGKLEEFIVERKPEHRKASHLHFHATVKSMAAGTLKPKPETSKRALRGS
jgi:hypothetical protein